MYGALEVCLKLRELTRLYCLSVCRAEKVRARAFDQELLLMLRGD